jgi:hypothetical protein
MASTWFKMAVNPIFGVANRMFRKFHLRKSKIVKMCVSDLIAKTQFKIRYGPCKFEKKNKKPIFKWLILSFVSLNHQKSWLDSENP